MLPLLVAAWKLADGGWLFAAGIALTSRVVIRRVESEEIEQEGAERVLGGVDGVLVPGGFGYRGVSGKVDVLTMSPIFLPGTGNPPTQIAPPLKPAPSPSAYAVSSRTRVFCYELQSLGVAIHCDITDAARPEAR